MTVDSRTPDDADGGAIDVVDDDVIVDDLDVDDDGYPLDDGEVDEANLGARPTSRAAIVPMQGPNARGGLRRQHIVGSVLFTRIVTAGLWLLVIGAVVLAVFALLVRTSPPPAPAPARGNEDASATARGDDAVLVAGFAQMAVRRYVGEAGEDTEATMDGLIAGGAPSLDGVTPGGFYVVDAVTVDVDDLGGGYWSAMVACDLMASIDEQYGPVGLRYYSVGVATGERGTGPVLVGLPSMVPAPPAAEAPELLASSAEAPGPDDPQVSTIREFLGALLLGEGVIQRYTAPGVQIAAISPSPFASLEIDDVAIADPEASETVARVTVHAVDERGLAQRLHYALDLQEREGRWEIARLATAPPVVEEEETGQ